MPCRIRSHFAASLGRPLSHQGVRTAESAGAAGVPAGSGRGRVGVHAASVGGVSSWERGVGVRFPVAAAVAAAVAVDAARIFFALAMAVAVVPRGRHHCTHAASVDDVVLLRMCPPRLCVSVKILGNETI